MNSLWKELRPLLQSVAAFSFCINLLFLIPAIFMMQVFDRVIPSNSTDTLLVLLGGTIVALLILLSLDYVRNRLQNALGAMVEEKLSPPVVKNIVAQMARMPHTSRTEAIRDVTALRNVFASSGLNALFDAPWVTVYVAVIWAFHPALGIGAAISATLMLALAWMNDRFSRGKLEDLDKAGRRASQYVESSLRNAEVLQALGMTERLLARWRKLQNEATSLQGNATRSGVAFGAGTRFFRQAIQIGMLALGAYLVLSQQASAGIMIATTVLLGRAIQPVEQLVASWRTLVDARAAYRRLRELLPNEVNHDEHVRMPRPAGRITVENISFRAPGSDKIILNGIGFELAPGEALAIIGASAAGKSTLARLLTGVWVASVGTVRLDGADIAHWPRHDVGPWIGYVPQDVELFDGSVGENIARLDEVDSEKIIQAAKRASAHDMILDLAQGYNTQVGEQGLRLSPGQRQRIALARALYGNPSLVILDEPNSNLDAAGEAALAHALRALRTEGVTSIVVTHRPALIAHVDKILVMEGGRIKQYGAANDVLKAMQRHAQAVADNKAA